MSSHLFISLSLLILIGATAAIATYSIAAFCRRRYIKFGASLTALTGTVVFLIKFASALGTMNAGFTFLDGAPVESELVGSYSIDPISVPMLRQNGNSDFSGTITLSQSHSFIAKRMPKIWRLGDSSTDYESLSGRWKVDRVFGDDRMNVTVDTGSETLIMSIAAKTEQRPHYALGVPLNHGDAGYIIFVKQER